MIHLIGEDARSVPDWFRRRLRDIDPALVVYFNAFRQEFEIDRCTRGADCLSSTHIECPKTNVHSFPHIGEAVLDEIKAMDAWAKTSARGGDDQDALKRFRREHEIAAEEYREKLREDSRENYRNTAREDRVQLNKALHLMQQHDITRVNQ